jgi:hypothetical protein
MLAASCDEFMSKLKDTDEARFPPPPLPSPVLCQHRAALLLV